MSEKTKLLDNLLLLERIYYAICNNNIADIEDRIEILKEIILDNVD